VTPQKSRTASPALSTSALALRWTPEEVMPTYQFRCEKCGKRFERTETIAEHEAVKPQCTKCGSKKVTFVPGRVFVVTSKKS
jgi:putative FmdB family regulatory protein